MHDFSSGQKYKHSNLNEFWKNFLHFDRTMIFSKTLKSLAKYHFLLRIAMNPDIFNVIEDVSETLLLEFKKNIIIRMQLKISCGASNTILMGHPSLKHL